MTQVDDLDYEKLVDYINRKQYDQHGTRLLYYTKSYHDIIIYIEIIIDGLIEQQIKVINDNDILSIFDILTELNMPIIPKTESSIFKWWFNRKFIYED